ncbi:MAG TPA: hypothetical protein VMY87_00985 [Armatimonadota bacterium]|nr:hypothetical protein [Armatimonadota bacterium]
MQGPRRGAREAKPVRQLPECVRKVLEHVVLVASAGVILSLAYLLFIILSGGLAAPIVRGTALDAVSRNVNLARNGFLWSLWIVVAAAMIRHYRTESTGWVTMLVGVGCWLALPLVVRSRTESTTAQELMEVGQSLISGFQTSGGAMMVLGFLRVALGRIIVLASPTQAAMRFTTYSPEAAAIVAERALEHPSLMRQCWELHFCRSSLRASCPRFVSGVSCWKKNSGCYCDQGLATRLLTGVGANARVKVAEELKVAQRRARQQEKRQKAPCGECPLYLDHQKYKYRVVSWLAYPAAAAVIGFTVGSIQNGYRWVELELGSVLGNLQILPRTLSHQPLEQVAWLSAENATVLLIGVLFVGIILQLTEVAIFRLKL